MKKSEFRSLIREEIKKVLNEETSKKYSFDELTNLLKSWKKNKDKNAEKALLSIGFFKLDKDEDTGETKVLINGYGPKSIDYSEYKTTDGKSLLDLYDWFREYVTKGPSQTKPTKTPARGMKINDDDLVDKGYIRPDDADGWLELFSDEGDDMPYEDYVNMANDWLKSNKYTFRMDDIVDKDEDEGKITWKVK